ncbi:MAG: type I DNA topoisomerase [Candidatus Colwellbacteria bacterium]|nr:type I DNA topoisomerase [Candidatus Colwellbacteria bacterium]
MNLVIVESPTKAKTIGKFLPKEFTVESSYGHVRDLPKGRLGVDPENNFTPQYVIPRKNQKRVTALKKLAAKAEIITLATDEDREGEAIAWHLIHALKLDETRDVKRIVFHEITKSAIEEALKKPRQINTALVDAQQARRILDRLVGYKLSPFLWKKVRGGLSAGRVQSVALKLIAEREEEIQKFKPEEYWSIDVDLKTKRDEIFEANLASIDGKSIEKLEIKNEKAAKAIETNLNESEFKVTGVTKRATKKNPLPPFTTSTLQQTASSRLYFSAKKTMMLAQRLYEEGRITYMRTDSLNLANEAVLTAKDWITESLGKEYAADAPRYFKTKSRLAQEAHEAIRPTRPDFAPQNLGGQAKLKDDEVKLYDLIWRRFIASQLPPAGFDTTLLEIEASSAKSKYGFRANGQILRFDGFLKIWPTKFSEKELPDVKKDEELDLVEVKSVEHFTEPPPRYNEASLVKTLEEYGIGRPSTYAPIISVIQDRGYVEKDSNRRFTPTEIGILVNRILKEHFPEVIDVGFTAELEEDFDKIASGKEKWPNVVKEFYIPFNEHLLKKYEEVEKENLIEETDVKCELCGKPMVIKFGRFGRFMACSGYPECKNTKTIKEPPKTIGMKCLGCSEGEVVIRKTRKGRIFYGCSRYPDCNWSSWQHPGKKESGTGN